MREVISAMSRMSEQMEKLVELTIAVQRTTSSTASVVEVGCQMSAVIRVLGTNLIVVEAGAMKTDHSVSHIGTIPLSRNDDGMHCRTMTHKGDWAFSTPHQ